MKSKNIILHIQDSSFKEKITMERLAICHSYPACVPQSHNVVMDLFFIAMYAITTSRFIILLVAAMSV